MEHKMLELTKTPSSKNLVLYQKDNNLDQKDNLQELPEEPAVFAICGRVNGKPANCRAVGKTSNLRESIIEKFKGNDTDECLKTFMKSIKTKELVYEIMSGSTEADRAEKMGEWQKKFNPICTEELNKVY